MHVITIGLPQILQLQNSFSLSEVVSFLPQFLDQPLQKKRKNINSDWQLRYKKCNLTITVTFCETTC